MSSHSRPNIGVMITEGNPIAAVDNHRATQLSMEGEAAIGRIAVWASLLERNLEELTQRLRGSSPSDAPLSGSRAITEAKALTRGCAALKPADAAQIMKVLKESKELLKSRNIVIHAVVGTSMKRGAATFRTHPKNPDRVLTAADLDQFAKQLHSTAWEVFDCSMTVARVLGKLARDTSELRGSRAMEGVEATPDAAGSSASPAPTQVRP